MKHKPSSYMQSGTAHSPAEWFNTCDYCGNEVGEENKDEECPGRVKASLHPEKDEQPCPRCGGKLQRVKNPSGSYYNDEQFDSMRAGDYFCDVCKGDRGKSGYLYFWEHGLKQSSASSGDSKDTEIAPSSP